MTSIPNPKNGELVKRVRDWIELGVPQGPYSLQLSPTMACDLNCVFCRRQDQLKEFYGKNKEIPNCKYVQLVRDAIDSGVRSIIIKGGGEPLLRKSLMAELIPLIKSQNIAGNLVTNGTHLDQTLAGLLVSYGWDQVTFSLDGSDSNTHDYLRAKSGTFARVMEAIDTLNALKSRHGARAPSLGFHCVLTSRNYCSIGQMIELAHAQGVDRLELDSMSLRFENIADLLMDEAKTQEFWARLPAWIEQAKGCGISTNLERFQKREYVSRDKAAALYSSRNAADSEAALTRVPCYYPWYQAAVTPAGNIVPCCYSEETHKSEANLNEVSFKEAWFKRDPEEYRRRMLDGSMMPFCKDCTAMYADNNREIRQWLKEDPHAG